MVEIIGFILGIFIGISLGMIGSGGSILTIPTLVYLMHILPSQATVYSMFIVGVSAMIGGIKGAYDKLVDFKMAFYFGLPSIISVFIMRKFIVPLLPNTLFMFSNFEITKDFFIMLLFATLMLLASIAMIRNKQLETKKDTNIDTNKFIFKGILVGFITGFIGVGGGFLIIPTLIFSAKMEMKNAVATSLWIIAANSLVGFFGSMYMINIDWNFLLKFTFLALIGIFIGLSFGKKFNNHNLKPFFGWFVLITGIYIIVKELFF